MNSQTVHSFLSLHPSQRLSVMRELNINLSQGTSESPLEYSTRVLQMIDRYGIIRELENSMRRFQ